jgi:hypothetical protein
MHNIHLRKATECGATVNVPLGGQTDVHLRRLCDEKNIPLFINYKLQFSNSNWTCFVVCHLVYIVYKPEITNGNRFNKAQACSGYSARLVVAAKNVDSVWQWVFKQNTFTKLRFENVFIWWLKTVENSQIPQLLTFLVWDSRTLLQHRLKKAVTSTRMTLVLTCCSRLL